MAISTDHPFKLITKEEEEEEEEEDKQHFSRLLWNSRSWANYKAIMTAKMCLKVNRLCCFLKTLFVGYFIDWEQ